MFCLLHSALIGSWTRGGAVLVSLTVARNGVATREVLFSTGGTPFGKGLSVYSEPTGTLTGQSHYRTQQLIVEQ